MDRKFKVLRIIGTIYKILGIITGVITVLLALGVCLASVLGGAAIMDLQRELGVDIISSALVRVFATALILLVGVVNTAMLYGVGEGIYLLLALEENTRRTADYLQQFSGDSEYQA